MSLRWMCLGLLLLAALPGARAGCSRAIQVPLAEIGVSVNFEGERIVGAYPRLLKELSGSSGCDFVTQQVPRARLQLMFENGQADLMLPASRTAARDVIAEFVPLIMARPSLLSLKSDRSLPRSLAELQAQPDFRLATVRGFSYGVAYEALLTQLREQHRLQEEADVVGVVRALRRGMAHGTLMTPSIMVGTLVSEPGLSELLPSLRVDTLPELPWVESGLYLSRKALSEADRALLRQTFSASSKRAWQLLIEAHPPGSLGDSLKPQ